jgi:hypothetical protein
VFCDIASTAFPIKENTSNTIKVIFFIIMSF